MARRAGKVIRGTASQSRGLYGSLFPWRNIADCFMLTFSLVPSGLNDFIDLIVPELRRRGLFRDEYEGHTLRSHLGLPRPASRHRPGCEAGDLAAG